MTEYLIAMTAQELRARGDKRLSLNFATWGRLFEPGASLSVAERAQRRLAAVLSPYFQIRSLRDFNAKFDPEWVPRSIVVQDPEDLAVGRAAVRGRRGLRAAASVRAMSADRLAGVLEQARRDRSRLDGGAFGLPGLTALGIASVVGAGIFVTTGVAAAQNSGPAVAISFLLAAVVAAATAFCYAELAAMLPVAGSTYSYAYVAFGLFPAWFIGWDLLIEYLLSSSTVAVGWSGYADSLLGLHIARPGELAGGAAGGGVHGAADPRDAHVARANAVIVALKLVVLVLVVVLGALHVHPSTGPRSRRSAPRGCCAERACCSSPTSASTPCPRQRPRRATRRGRCRVRCC